MENSFLDEIDSEFSITYSKTRISKSKFFPLQFYSWDIAIVWSNQWKNCQLKIFVTFFGPNLLPKWGHFWCTYHNCRSLPKWVILDVNTHFSKFLPSIGHSQPWRPIQNSEFHKTHSKTKISKSKFFTCGLPVYCGVPGT